MASPVLADRFFIERRPTGAFFQQWKKAGPWTPSLMPIYEWEGLLFVACPDPASVMSEPHWCLVKASAVALGELWAEWTGEAISFPHANYQPEAETEAAHPADPLAEPISVPQAASSPEDLFQLGDEESSPAVGESTDEEAGAESLELISDEEKLATLGETQAVSLDSLTRPRNENETPAPALKSEAPASPTPAMVELKTSSPKPPPQMKATLKPPVEPKTVTAIRPPPAPPVEVGRKALPQTPPVTQQKVAPSSPTPPPPPNRSAATGVARTATLPSASQDEWTELWSLLTPTYEHAMVLTIQDGQVTPVQWDPKLKPAKTNVVYAIQSPSPFRIVAKTQNAYHGPVFANSITDAFFRTWNKGEMPPVLTVSPLLQDDVVKGFLLVWGQKSAETKEALSFVQKAAGRIAPLVVKKTASSRSA